MEKNTLFGLLPEEIAAIVEKYGARAYTAKQIAEWMYARRVFSYDEMSNLPKHFRDQLKNDYPEILVPYSNVQISKDGTKKYLFEFSGGRSVETAVIPDDDRLTVCVSSQAGCRFGCRFCATGSIGYHGNLTSGEILNQLMAIDEHDKITNIVYMGMGEPLDNWAEVYKSLEILTSEKGFGLSASRITVSTIGIKASFKELLEKTKVNIAVSLHSPFPEERMHIMPAQISNPVIDILDMIVAADLPKHRKLSFEYILFKGINISRSHALKLADIAIRCNAHINLIVYNDVPGLNFEAPIEREVLTFQNELIKKGATATIRRSRGLDIAAACGTLAGKR
ncbi:MAG: 23S rRNA (adenine(2503)-C(2))-methyltransferase [Bacteroidetes bacterium GWF2_43_63]|nr:MAG: 23S rRNA (adenine(2503)-C(2))-methyltransferase [Bacteroidetes bacterium GWE2_42_42]OFY54157.1 MAG: 23S rRNA (adenine(2503)-C(2))-methyltransferase [Bacteroidetes bacterium GWF2_43_63]HBG70803.1 23S rRNA (adenine(2503)-C(2))-methyltransferase RlmN [Bacteroidales bacterium]HCB61707.1 23S rRNA (adenine(2503)-C(2))-methyltransferase RlmN [Bacteroidales bacterium]HCY22083.1 23S rRNA (adenine(2503)-C(2))-methyltransferase RlmN [Bacteroidales bacterium]